jgi:hypothetical protein
MWAERCDVANERVRVMEGVKDGTAVKKTGGFKPSTPNGYVRPKPVAVPAKTK